MRNLSNRAYYEATAISLARTPTSAILGALVSHHHFEVDLKQRDAWIKQIEHLKELAAAIPDGHFFLEFAIPRMGKRADVVVVARGIVFVLEYKVGAREHARSAIDQVLDYALDLKNFHEGSRDRPIVPILVATEAPPEPLELETWLDKVVRPILANSETTRPYMQSIMKGSGSCDLDPVAWAASPYKPTPTIVEAAQALYQGHDVRDISRSEAGAENLSRTAAYLVKVIEYAKANHTKAICFVTGVPGSGKTLAGLNIANERMKAQEDEHAVFLSGNGPLVEVLREALAVDEVAQLRVACRPITKNDARRNASVFIQNIHHFRDDCLKTPAAPTEHVVVFDEAQRAWTEEQTSRFMQEKKGYRDFRMSEPQFLLSVMDRHRDWCVVVCLIGGGQEINTGEAGLQEWLKAIEEAYQHWDVHISDRLTKADYLDVAAKAPTAIEHARISPTSALHLAVSVRSFRAEALSDFVGAIIDGDSERARSLREKLDHYPLMLTRDLGVARAWLREQARGNERVGLVASSNGMRLKPEGVHVKARINPADWFLAGKDDVRSSFALEDAATEFDIQGLELDWVGMCWDANFRRMAGAWQSWSFRGSRWERINDPTRVAYLANAYRVLLTRARQGMIIFVPKGSKLDCTRSPAIYDETHAFLTSCGIANIP